MYTLLNLTENKFKLTTTIYIYCQTVSTVLRFNPLSLRMREQSATERQKKLKVEVQQKF